MTQQRDAQKIASLIARVDKLERLLSEFAGDRRDEDWVPLKAATRKVPYSTLQRWVAEGRLACRRRGGRIFVNLRELDGIIPV